MNTGFKAIKMITDLFTLAQKEVGKSISDVQSFTKYKFFFYVVCLGLLCMQMFTVHLAGQQMLWGKKDGFFFHLVRK